MPIKGRGGMNVSKRSRASNIIPELAEDSMYGYVSNIYRILYKIFRVQTSHLAVLPRFYYSLIMIVCFNRIMYIDFIKLYNISRVMSNLLRVSNVYL